jgi:transcriptional regulator
MYQPAHFRQTDPQALHELVRAHPLGTLITLDADGNPVADELPFLLEPEFGGQGRLLAHVARANPLWQAHPAQREVLVLFRGPQAYVSPNWYPSKAEHGKAVPTWNYSVVQARGQLRLMAPGSAELSALLRQLTAVHEASQPQPWQMDDAPPDYLAAMLQAVVGLEISVSAWAGKFKLSQNQPPANRQGVRQALDEHPLAGMMEA